MQAFHRNDPAFQLRGDLPKVGIRPTIDGRRKGIREGLEAQTMGMAKAVAALIESELKHPCGLPVECVIADTTIGGVAEAAECEAKFSRENVGLTVTVTPCWCYGSETLDMDPLRPKAIWGFNGTERPGAVYLASALAGHNQKGLPAFSLYSHDVQDAGDGSIPEDVQEKLLRFVRAGLAVATMRGKSYLGMGGMSMGIAGSIMNAPFLEKYLGMRMEQVDMVEFVRRWEEGIYDHEEFELAKSWVDEYIRIGWDKNPEEVCHSPEKQREVLETCILMTMIARDLMIGNEKLAAMGYVEESCGHNAIAAGFQGQRQWTDHFPNGDMMEALLNSSFDWNGIREPMIVATENDHLNGLAMLFGKLMTGRAQGFADVRTYWSPESVERVAGWKTQGAAAGGFIHLINSGAAALDGTGRARNADGAGCMKPWWEMTGDDRSACLDAVRWTPADRGYFAGGGFSCQYETAAEMPVTMVRLNLVEGIGPVLQLCEGQTVVLPEQVDRILYERTDPTWPSTWFAPRPGEGAARDAYSLMANWGSNHAAFCYGHIGADLVTLASMLRIPVSLHNLPDSRLFRPHSWSAFGTRQLEAADYAACRAYGPLYR